MLSSDRTALQSAIKTENSIRINKAMSRTWTTIYRNPQNFQVCFCFLKSLYKNWNLKTEHTITELSFLPKRTCTLQTRCLFKCWAETKTLTWLFFIAGQGENCKEQFVHPHGAGLGLTKLIYLVTWARLLNLFLQRWRTRVLRPIHLKVSYQHNECF